MGASSSREKVRLIETKLSNASKTGILNLESLQLKSQSHIWSRLSTYTLTFTSKVKVLNISKNDLRTIPGQVFQLTNIRKMFVSNCSLQRLDSLERLSQLSVLAIDHNELDESTLAAFPVTLTQLDISHNHIRLFPTVFFNLFNIFELNLSSNRLISLTGIGALSGLKELNVDDNLLTELDDEVGTLPLLQILSVQRNRLSPMSSSGTAQSISSRVFTTTVLDHLNLAGNEGLTKAAVLKFEGIDVYLERRNKSRMKNFASGALGNESEFGLDG